MTVQPGLYDRLLVDLEALSRQAITIVEATEPFQQKLEAASALLGVLQPAYTRVVELRAEAAVAIHQAEGLSLAGLAGRLGVSKGRAEQILKQQAAKKEEG